MSGATSPREPVFLDRTRQSLLGSWRHVGGPTGVWKGCTHSVRTAYTQRTHQHCPVAQTATEVHQVDLPGVLLVHKTGPEVHPTGGELQCRQGHKGSKGHLLGIQACDSVRGEVTLPAAVAF